MENRHGFLVTGIKNECTGCEACSNCCPTDAIRMVADADGFRYPVTDADKCIKCGLCHRVCPEETAVTFSNTMEQRAFGGQVTGHDVLQQSTSGGAFSALMEVWAAKGSPYAIFGVEADGLSARHSYVTEVSDAGKYRKSKYVQSNVGRAYADVKRLLQEGVRVIFSGTPCQIAGLKNFLGRTPVAPGSLMTVEVVCEGVPSPLYVDKMHGQYASKGLELCAIDYRYKDGAKWDFQVMKKFLKDRSGKVYTRKKDRWFNRFWSIWLSHLMSRPSCYHCRYARRERVADITLGDLWGVHIYCPDLYDHDRGASLMVANTSAGYSMVWEAMGRMQGHELDMSMAVKYQGPMRSHIADNPRREEFMADLRSEMTLRELNRKWSKGPSLRLLWQKYVWGNRQKVALWKLKKNLGIG